MHGGANEAVLDMLIHIGSVENVPNFLESVKRKEKKLMGFGRPYVPLNERRDDGIDESNSQSKRGNVPINVHPYNRRYTIAMKSRI